MKVKYLFVAKCIYLYTEVRSLCGMVDREILEQEGAKIGKLAV